MWPQLSIPRFAPDIEQEFQASYYARIRPTLRLVSGVLAGTLVVYLLLGARQINPFISTFSTPYLAFCLLLFGLTYAPTFGRHWQSTTVTLGLIASATTLLWLAATLKATPPPDMDARSFGIISHLLFLLQTCVLMVGLAAFRLQLRPAFFLQSGIVAVGLFSALFVLPPDMDLWNAGLRFLEPVLLVLLVVLLAALVQEQLARNAAEANRRLLVLEAQERHKRLETEKMLHVLNGAIGGIVHDLGNPLTSVQLGASTLTEFLDDGADRETLREFATMIESGAKMLNFLRLSLIEQSRVLEGQPVPVELKPVSVRAIVEAGVSFQKPRFSHGHTLSIEDGDATICADEMKMVTVLMNLIGNALKYSDGQVRVAWQTRDSHLLLGVLDEGTAGRGLTLEQAQRLFTAFGRLETHQNIEGTGLGLMSVQKIVEAHGGTVWSEGTMDGTSNSPPFSTGTEGYPPLLSASFRTAFVLSCPLAAKSKTG